MKVQQKHYENEEDYGRYASLIIEIDGKEVFSLGGGEPEDMTLGRDLNCAYDVVSLMQRAYNAGKSGEEFEILDDITIDEY
jgi:hypothetical protein